MVYTQQRLQQALEVFRKSEPYRKLRNLGGKNLGNLLEDKVRQYETRSGEKPLRATLNLPGTWKDAEDSDDYSPRKKKNASKDNKNISGQGQPKRKQSLAGISDDKKSQKRAKASYARGRQEGWNLEVTLKFHSEEARAMVAALFPAPKIEMPPRMLTPPATPNSAVAAPKKENALTVTPPKMLNFGSLSSLPTPSASPHTPWMMEMQSNSVQNPIVLDDSDDPMTDAPSFRPANNSINKTPYTKVIRTRFSHPIQYKCLPYECNFCKDARIQLLGCRDERRVEVLVMGPGRYEELDGGPQGAKPPATKICSTCCVNRIDITNCQHEIVPFDGHLREEVDYTEFVNEAMQDTQGKLLTCSVCVGQALYVCGIKKQVSMSFYGGNVQHGCGLMLCKKCAGIVKSRGRLDSKVFEQPGTKMRRNDLRADCEFILPGNDLMLACGK